MILVFLYLYLDKFHRTRKVLLLCLLRLHNAPSQPSSSSVRRKVIMLFFFICSICFLVNNPIDVI